VTYKVPEKDVVQTNTEVTTKKILMCSEDVMDRQKVQVSDTSNLQALNMLSNIANNLYFFSFNNSRNHLKHPIMFIAQYEFSL